MALLLCHQGNAPEAEQTVRYALEYDDHSSLGQVILATVLVYLKRIDEAERSAREALRLDAKTPDAYLVLAAVHGSRNDYIDEVKDLDAFLKLEPRGPRTDSVRGIRAVADGLATRMRQQQ